LAAYNLPDDLSAVEADELESFETIIFMELTRFQEQTLADAEAEIPLETIQSLTNDLKSVRAELAAKADKVEVEKAKGEILADAFALLETNSEETTTEVAAAAEVAEVAPEETLQTEEAPADEVTEQTLETAAAVLELEAVEAPAAQNVYLTVNLGKDGDIETLSTPAGAPADAEVTQETVTEEVAETLETEPKKAASEKLADEGAPEAAPETAPETAPEAGAEEALSEESTVEEEVEAPVADEATSETLADEAATETEAVEGNNAQAAEETATEELGDKTVATDEAAQESQSEEALTDADSTEGATAEDVTSEATEVLDDATATDEQSVTDNETQTNAVSSDEVEDMTETLNSELAPTEVVELPGNATMNPAVDGMNFAAAATGGSIKDYSDVTKIFSSAFESLGGSNQWRGVRQGASDFIRLVTVEADNAQDVPSLGLTNEVNTAVLEQVADDFVAKRSEDQYGALVASGGICAPCPIDFSLNRIAVAMNPIESSLPVVRAPRGCYAYTRRVNWTQAAREGIAVITPADDAAGYVSTPAPDGPGPTPDKPCVTVPCPDTDKKCCIKAIWWCMRVSNFQLITWPEHIDAFLQDLLVAFAAEKEQTYLYEIDAASVVQFSNAAGYNLRSNLEWILRNAMINYRKSMHLPLDGGARMTALIPDWLVEAVKQDYANFTGGADSLSTADVDRWFRNIGNIDPTYYYDGIACGDPADMMAECKEDGAPVAEFPSQACIYFWNPGDVIRLFTTTLDFGMVRDHILNSTNDVIMAAEEFTSLCIKEPPCKIVFPVCPSGAHPPRAAEPVCGHNGEIDPFEEPEGYGNIPFCAEPEQDGPGSICNDPAMYSDIVCPE